MRAHKNTLLAMRLSTVLMSISALFLVILLLMSKALAERKSEIDSQPQQAIVSPTNHVAATPDTQIAVVRATQTLALRPFPQPYASTFQATIPAIVKRASNGPTAKPVKSIVASARPAAGSANAGLPSLPQLAAIPDLPSAPAPVASGGGGGGGSGGAHAAPQPQQQPHPQPQPPVKTKTS